MLCFCNIIIYKIIVGHMVADNSFNFIAGFILFPSFVYLFFVIFPNFFFIILKFPKVKFE